MAKKKTKRRPSKRSLQKRLGTLEAQCTNCTESMATASEQPTCEVLEQAADLATAVRIEKEAALAQAEQELQVAYYAEWAAWQALYDCMYGGGTDDDEYQPY